jgi:putative hydrolase of the HAD superfamily
MRARYLMEEMGLGAHVDGIVYSAALGVRKPMPEFYRLAQERTGVEAGEIVFVDDVAANVEAAKAVGWNSVLWTGERRLRDIAR